MEKNKNRQGYLFSKGYTNYVFILLKCLEVNREILKEFLQFFNYDFDHTGYSKEAEKLESKNR